MMLTDAILKKDRQQVAELLTQNPDVNELDIYGFTPLMEAAIVNDIEIANQLIEHGADVNKPDLTGGSALYWAVENNNIKLCELLLRRGANANAYGHSSQPVLVMPLLRRQQSLRELLIRHGADLKFAQDYIQAKLIGHRFELVGSVDIADTKEMFTQVDFEGFILEFTIGVILDSLWQFRNNFSARNLRRYFGELRAVIDAFRVAAELLHYQQHLTDQARIKARLQVLANRELLLLPVGYEGHAITFIRCGPFFAKCDRGENSLREPSVAIYKINNPRAWTPEFLQRLLYEQQSRYFVTQGIFQTLALSPVAALPLHSQLIGNCSWANVEAAIPAILLMLWLRRDTKGLPENTSRYQKMAMAIYRQWLTWDKEVALQQCLESFPTASSARQASKASLLAAVLFQTCRHQVPKDLPWAYRIFSILTIPDFQYILASYLSTYKNTDAGRNLLELVDLCK